MAKGKGSGGNKGGGKGKGNSKWGAPMVATGDGKILYTYPTGNSDDY